MRAAGWLEVLIAGEVLDQDCVLRVEVVGPGVVGAWAPWPQGVGRPPPPGTHNSPPVG